MERIIIREEDLTNSVAESSSVDVVFIPGFSKLAAGTISGNYVAPEAFVPTLCTNLNDFIGYFGNEPVTFTSNQSYPAYVANSASGFVSNAIPTPASGETSSIMFAQGTPDPSYIIAKELVKAGIPVLYEKVNNWSNITKTIAQEQQVTNPTYTLDHTKDDIELTTLVVTVDDEVVSAAAISLTGTSLTITGTITANSTVKITYKLKNDPDVSVLNMYNKLYSHVFNTDGAVSLLDKDFNVKYITSGGYPTFEYNVVNSQTSATIVNAISSTMANIAQSRGDAIALIDHTDNENRDLTGVNSVFSSIGSTYPISPLNDQDTFAAMITPHGVYDLAANYNSITQAVLPGSFAYLISLANSLKTYPSYYAIAGAVRGLVPGLKRLHINKLLTNAIANSYQIDNGISINAITNIKPYGLCIWGNRTLRDSSSISRKGYALEFLNLRNLVSDVKKQAYLAAQSLMFEPNTDVLWINFKSMMTPLLDKMVSGSGLSGYKIVKVTTESKTKLKASIQIYPVYSVESFEITIQITDDEVSVA